MVLPHADECRDTVALSRPPDITNRHQYLAPGPDFAGLSVTSGGVVYEIDSA
ncbi:hypothetical protein SAMN05216207_10922 [Pseudonocardia ammonioxydans]|uniref:Uncharacterized protein n=1 Tax=Pseudonocardia ammonioxydans TaxID=260086 RepID=A0A1I5I9V8_PSUAM|nr:hypothetical protein SAMN05216207_10922 [Pseudonocardia ammonioxydans]